MTRILTTIHLSDIQKEVLLRTMVASNPHIAWEQITVSSDDDIANFAAARDMLGDMGFLDVGDATLSVTDRGIAALKDENLVDQSGQITDVGQSLIDDSDKLSGQQPATESYSLLKEINNSLKPSQGKF